MDPVYPMLVRIVGVLLWSSAVTHKVRFAADFRALLQQYRLPFPQLHGAVVAVLIVVEAALAVMFCLPTTLPLACWGSAALLGVYAIVLVREILAGRTTHPCGCVGHSATAGIGWPLVWRNVVLAALFLGATFTARERPWTWLDSFTVVAAAVALTLLFLAVDALVQSPMRRVSDKANGM